MTIGAGKEFNPTHLLAAKPSPEILINKNGQKSAKKEPCELEIIFWYQLYTNRRLTRNMEYSWFVDRSPASSCANLASERWPAEIQHGLKQKPAYNESQYLAERDIEDQYHHAGAIMPPELQHVYEYRNKAGISKVKQRNLSDSANTLSHHLNHLHHDRQLDKAYRSMKEERKLQTNLVSLQLNTKWKNEKRAQLFPVIWHSNEMTYKKVTELP